MTTHIRTRRPTKTLAVIALALALGGAAQTLAQGPDRPPTGTLVIAGDVRQPQTWQAADIKTLPRSTAIVEENGQTQTYEGVLVGELLARAGATLGNELRGDAVTTYVLASATDGYQVVYSLAELDPSYTRSTIIVADSMNGQPLPATQGPLRIVVPGDAHRSRSIRMLERLDVVRLRKP